MIVVITSNLEVDENFKPHSYCDENFLISMLVYDRTDVMKNAVAYYDNDRYDIYCRKGMDVSELKESYSSEDDPTEYHFREIIYAGEAFNDISEKLESLDKYDPMVILACNETVNRKLASYLKKDFTVNSVEIVPINILSYYKVPNLNALTEVIKKSLNTQFIYQDDPVHYGMAVALLLRKSK